GPYPPTSENAPPTLHDALPMKAKGREDSSRSAPRAEPVDPARNTRAAPVSGTRAIQPGNMRWTSSSAPVETSTARPAQPSTSRSHGRASGEPGRAGPGAAGTRASKVPDENSQIRAVVSK